jgi:hypothetical protein
MAITTVVDLTGTQPAAVVQALLAANSGITVVGDVSLVASGPGAVNLYDATTGAALGIGAGVLLTSGATPGTSNTLTWYGSDNSGPTTFLNGDADIDAVVNTVFQTQSYDATALSFNFKVNDPACTSISFDLVFGSEEYPEWVDAFVDCAVVIVDGVNYALFNKDPKAPLSVISPNLAAGYFKDNAGGILPIEYDGVSGLLRIVAPLDAGRSTHTIKIAIADTGDHILDSGLFIANLSAGRDPGSGVVSNPGGGTTGDDNCTGTSKDEYFNLLAGDDTVYAGGGADIIVAGDGKDQLFGGSGADELKGDAGDDLVDGGSDLDTAVYAGASQAYVITYDAASDSYSLKATATGEGVDRLYGVEQIRFSDGLFGLTPSGLIAPSSPPPPPGNNAGSLQITDLAGAPLIGSVARGTALVASINDLDGISGAVSVQWMRGNQLIAGASTDTYVVQEADIGTVLSVAVNYVDAGGHAESHVSAGLLALPSENGDLLLSLMGIEGPASAAVNTPITTLLLRAVEQGETPNTALQKIRAVLQVPQAVPSLLSTNAFKILQSSTSTTSEKNMALALAKLEVQVAILCSASADPTGANLTAVLLERASNNQIFNLASVTDLETISGVVDNGSLDLISQRNGNIQKATMLLGTGDSLENEWADFISGWDVTLAMLPLNILSHAINLAPLGTPTAALPHLAAGIEAFSLSAALLLQGLQDPDNDPLTVSGLTTDRGDWFVPGAAGGWELDTTAPAYDPSYSGPLELSYSVEDGHGHSLAVSQMLVVDPQLNHAPTGAVNLSGSACQGQTLSADLSAMADLDGIPGSGAGAPALQWLADGVEISGATGSSLLLGQAQVGREISLKVAYTDGLGKAEAMTSAATAKVANVNDAPTGGVTISGTAMEGQVLTAQPTLADADGLGAITTRWLADGALISGATGVTYTLTAADVGRSISAIASYTDGYGTAESVTSAATAPVASADVTPPSLASVAVNGLVVSLGFSEALAAAGLPASTAFTVQTVSSTGTITSRSVSSLAVDGTDPSGRRLLLTLGGTAPASNVDLRVTYTDPTGNQSSGVLQDAAGNDVATLSNRYATRLSSAASVTSLASKYTDLILTGSSAINGTANGIANTISGNGAANSLSGGAGNDSASGGAGNDTLLGGAGADLITGGLGNDVFRLTALSESLLAGFDRISDFSIGSDSIDGPTAVSATSLKDSVGTVSALTQSALQAVLTTTTFLKSGASTFTFNDATLGSRSFLALNDGTAGYSASTDAIVEITGYSGLLTNLAVV